MVILGLLFPQLSGGADDMAYEGTPAAEMVETHVLQTFPGYIVQVGQYNRRQIDGSTAWSQHSWGNAIDLHLAVDRPANAAEKVKGDEIAAYLRAHKEAMGIRTILWWVTNHYDHIHVDMWPKGVLTPPLSSTGVGTFQYSSGARVDMRIQLVPAEGAIMDEDMSVVITTLRGQNMAYYRALQAKTGVPAGNADYWGSDYTGTPKPTMAEWAAAADDLLGASLQVGVFAPAANVDNVARAAAVAAQKTANSANQKVVAIQAHLRATP